MEVTGGAGDLPFPNPSTDDGQPSSNSTIQAQWAKATEQGGERAGQGWGGPTGKQREQRWTVTLPSWQRPSPRENEISTLAFRLGSIREGGGDTQGTGSLSALSSPEAGRATGRTGLWPGGHPAPRRKGQRMASRPEGLSGGAAGAKKRGGPRPRSHGEGEGGVAGTREV